MPNSSKYFQYTLDGLKKSSDRKLFNVVSFFAGGGGSSCGYKLAGGDILCVMNFSRFMLIPTMQTFQIPLSLLMTFVM